MFADISGFTAISESMDPEDVMSLAARAANEMGDMVKRFGGTVLRIIGDEILAVFGAPVAHEDDTERAVRAALAIRDLELTNGQGEPIHTHIGINTGEVLAGLIGHDDRQDYEVMGDVVNTAARLRSAAPAGSVWVGSASYKASSRAVQYAPLPTLSARGKSEPVEAWEALQAFAVTHERPIGTAQFIGREEELTRLRAMWKRSVERRQTHLVTVFGEAGIGKSRLVTEFENSLPLSATILHGACFAYGAAHSYGALEMILREAAGITGEEGGAVARNKLGALVEDVVTYLPSATDPSLLAQNLALMSGLDVEGDRDEGARDGRIFRRSALSFLSGLAQRGPLCLIVENIHWAQSEMLDLVEQVAANAQNLPLLIVTLARPELVEHRSAWASGIPSYTSLSLHPMSATSERALILALCAEYGVDNEIAEEISRNVGGNPLFAEELVAMVAEQGKEEGVPVAVKLLISARLDTLPEAERQVMQVASVFGSAFWPGGLRSVLGRDVTEQLELLVRKGLLRLQASSRIVGELEYFFKHDLIGEVAYQIVSRAQRQALHGKAADWLEWTAGEKSEANFDLIARHAVQAEQHDRAIRYLMLSAERAGRSTAHAREIDLLNEAIEIAEKSGRQDLLPTLNSRQGSAFIDLGQWAAAERVLSHALDLMDPGDIEARVPALADIAWARFWLVDVAGEEAAAREAMSLAEKSDRDDLVVKAWFAVGQSNLNVPDIQATLEYCRGARERAGDTRTMEESMAAAISALVHYWQGNAAEAIEDAQAAAEMSQERHQTMPNAFALPHLGLALACGGRYTEAEEAFEQAKQFARTYELKPFLARSMSMSVGYHFDILDYRGHEESAYETREISLSNGLQVQAISSNVDLLMNFAARREVAQYEKLVPEVIEHVSQAEGFHGHLWRMRLAAAQAQLELARGDWEEVLRWAEIGFARSLAIGRPKYQALCLEAKAAALAGQNRRHEGIAELQSALKLLKMSGEPAILLRVAASLLALDGSDQLLRTATTVADMLAENIPNAIMRQRFEAAEQVQLIRSLTL